MTTTLQNWGIDLILWLQQFSPAFDSLFRFFTALGDELFFLLFLPMLYWCVDRRIGVRLALLFLLSTYLNSLAKLLADLPRPFEVDARVQALVEADTGGFPSGHTQSTVVVWGYLTNCYPRLWLWLLTLLLLIFVPLSRLYLGVHFPEDLVGGYLIGSVLLFLYLHTEASGSQWLSNQSLAGQLGLALLVPVGLLFLLPAVDDVSVAAAGTLLGMGIGFVVERRWVGFETDGSWRQRLLRFLLGGIVLGALYVGLRLAFAGLEPAWLWRFGRYAVLGLWGALAAPWFFVRFHLSPKVL